MNTTYNGWTNYETVERWLWKQLPEKAQFKDSGGDYVVDSLRLRYDPIEN